MSGRVIKFRSWDVHRNEWVKNTGNPYVFPFHGKTAMTCLGSSTGYIPNEDYSDEYILEQWTGLLDIKGVEIYEGDLIKVSDDYENYGQNAGEVYEVYFNAGGFRCKPHNPDYRGFWIEDGNDFTVIGNIHDTHTAEAGR